MKDNLFALSEEQARIIRYWAPAVITASVAWPLLLIVGDTPLFRASGLALAVLGVTASMRRMGFIASIAGGLTMTLCPIFWSQTGGGVSKPATIVLALGIAIAATILASIIIKRSYLGIGLGIALFVLIFWSQIGIAQSLRLTGLVTAWFMYLLVDMILLTNPRPGTKPPSPPKPYHTYGLLFLFAIGTINDPLVALFAPAILLGLFLSYAKLPLWYWLSAVTVICLGSGLLVRKLPLARAPFAWSVDLARGVELDRSRSIADRTVQHRWNRDRGVGTGAFVALVPAAGDCHNDCLRRLHILWLGLSGRKPRNFALATGDDTDPVDDLRGQYLRTVGQQNRGKRNSALDTHYFDDLPCCSCHFALEHHTILALFLTFAQNAIMSIVIYR